MNNLRYFLHRNHREVSATLVFAVTVYAFWPSLHNDFVKWDDPINFTDNPHYRGLGWEQLKWMFTSFHMGVYIPLTWISLAIDYHLWGLNPTGYHLTSLLLHAANSILVYLIARRLLETATIRRGDDPEASSSGAIIAALFFAVHPLRVESVAWATERRDVLCGFFFLASTLLHLESLTVSEYERRNLRAASLVCYLFSLLSKAASVPLPVLLIVIDFYISKKREPERHGLTAKNLQRAIVDKLPYLALAIPFAVVAPLGQARHSIMASASSLGLVDRIAVASYAVVFYLVKTFWPHNLSALYSLPVPFNSLEPRFILCALIALLASGGAARFAERWPAFSAAWAWYLIALVPTSGVLQAGFQIAADRYTYLPCLSWAMLVGAGFSEARHRLKVRSPAAAHLLWLGVGCSIAGLVILTRAQTLVWRDTLSLWRHVVELEPESILGHNNLGAGLAEEGHLSEAIPHFRFVLERDPERASARHNLEEALKVKETEGAAPH